MAVCARNTLYTHPYDSLTDEIQIRMYNPFHDLGW